MGKAKLGNSGNGNENNDSRTESGNSGAKNATGTATGTGNGTGTGTGTATGTGTGTATGTGTEKRTGKAGPGNNATIKPESVAPDEYERDSEGRIILNQDGSKRKKRGRKPGQTNSGESEPKSKVKKKTAKKGDREAVAVEMLAAQFQILNTGIAFLTRFDDWKLADNEATQMADATANVLAQFDYVPDPKMSAILGLVTTASMIYGPRAYLYRQHLNANREMKQAKRAKKADEKAATGFENGEYPLNENQFNYGGLNG